VLGYVILNKSGTRTSDRRISRRNGRVRRRARLLTRIALVIVTVLAPIALLLSRCH
jgi:hypothetical protein